MIIISPNIINTATQRNQARASGFADTIISHPQTNPAHQRNIKEVPNKPSDEGEAKQTKKS